MSYKNQSKFGFRLWHEQSGFGSKVYTWMFNTKKTKPKSFCISFLPSDVKQFDTIPGCRKSSTLII